MTDTTTLSAATDNNQLGAHLRATWDEQRNRMTVKQILPAPPHWLAFFYTTFEDKVTPWHWQPIAYMAHCVDDDGTDVVLPMISRDYGLTVPPSSVEWCVCHPAAAREWLYDGTDIVEVEALERYLEAVRP